MDRPTVFNQPACGACCNFYSSRSYVIKHLRIAHDRIFKSRTVGRKSYSPVCQYTRDKNARVDEVHLSCSSCDFTRSLSQDKARQRFNSHCRLAHDAGLPVYPGADDQSIEVFIDELNQMSDIFV